MPERTDQPPEQPTPEPCSNCNGAGGTVIDTSSDGVTRQTWKPCQHNNGGQL